MAYLDSDNPGTYLKINVLDQNQITTNVTYEPPSQVRTTVCDKFSPHPLANNRRISSILL